MELYKRPIQPIAAEADLPPVYVTIIDANQGVELPTPSWADIVELSTFAQLTTPNSERIVIIAVRDDDAELAKVQLVTEHPVQCGVQIHHVVDVVDYVASAFAEKCFWNAPVVPFLEWEHQIVEASREAELARRATLDTDEKRKEDNTRADGTVKLQQVIPDNEEPEPEISL